MSRRLSRYVSCAKDMHRNWSKQRNERTLASPPYLVTNLPKVFHGANSMTCAKTSLPAYIADPRKKAGSLPQKHFVVQVVDTQKTHVLLGRSESYASLIGKLSDTTES